MRQLAVLAIFALTACPSDDPEENDGIIDAGIEIPAEDTGVIVDAGANLGEDASSAEAGRADVRRFGPPEIGPPAGLDGGPVDKGRRPDTGGEDPVDRTFRCRDFCQNGFIAFDDQGNQTDCQQDRTLLLAVDSPEGCAAYCEANGENYSEDQWWLIESCVFERQCGDRDACRWNQLNQWSEEACNGICADQAQCEGGRLGANCPAECEELLQSVGARVGQGIGNCHRQAQDNQDCFQAGGTPEELTACQCDVREGCLSRNRDQVATVTALYCRLNEMCTGEPNDNACRNGYWFDHMAAAPNLAAVASCLQQFDEAHESCEGDAFQELDACIR
jgi:hypothetical protein